MTDDGSARKLCAIQRYWKAGVWGCVVQINQCQSCNQSIAWLSLNDILVDNVESTGARRFEMNVIHYKSLSFICEMCRSIVAAHYRCACEVQIIVRVFLAAPNDFLKKIAEMIAYIAAILQPPFDSPLYYLHHISCLQSRRSDIDQSPRTGYGSLIKFGQFLTISACMTPE